MEANLIVGGQHVAAGNDAAAVRRTRELLAQRLNLRNVVVLMGAGASLHLGGPEIRGLDAGKIDELVTGIGQQLDPAERNLVAALCRRTQDIERMLQILNASLEYAEMSGADRLEINGTTFAASAVVITRAKLNHMLAMSCDLLTMARIGNRKLNWEPHRELLRRIVTSRRDHAPARIFTTNYDVAIEYALDLNGYNYIDGFKGTVRRTFRPEVYSQAPYVRVRSVGQQLAPVPNFLYLYKLHGSINWRSADAEPDDVVISSAPLDSTDQLALIYPTQHKEAEALGYPYADMLRAFSDALLSGDVLLLIIGYGFRDDHINRLVDHAFATNVSLQAVVVDPYSLGKRKDGGFVFSDSRAALYAQRNDARIVALTGEAAKFTNFCIAIMPDVEADEPQTPSNDDE